MTDTTRFSDYPRWAAGLILAALAVFVAAAALQPAPLSPARGPRDGAAMSDTRLYRQITARVRRGEDYYAAAAAEQRAAGYPTSPAVAFREPTEALLLAALKNDGLRWAVLIGLGAATAEALRRGLAQSDLSPRLRLWTLAFGAAGLASIASPAGAYMHEVWAGLLILFSLASRRPERWALSVCAGVAACLFRETALPYLALMAAFAFCERRFKEAASWLVAAGLFCVVFAGHLVLAGGQHRAHDLTNAGWVRFGGLSFLIALARANAVLAMAPQWTIGAAMAASLLGLWGGRDPWIARFAATLTVFLALFAMVGRPDNLYWGFLDAPLLCLGLALAPAALRDLWTRAVRVRPAAFAPSSALTSSGS